MPARFKPLIVVAIAAIAALALAACSSGPSSAASSVSGSSSSGASSEPSSDETVLDASDTVFMSLDSSAGGGNPISDTVAMTGMLKPRASWDASDPIWSPSNTVTMAHTWLGTNEVDGTATGFNGRGQVLGFELPEQKSMGSQIYGSSSGSPSI